MPVYLHPAIVAIVLLLVNLVIYQQVYRWRTKRKAHADPTSRRE